VFGLLTHVIPNKVHVCSGRLSRNHRRGLMYTAVYYVWDGWSRFLFLPGRCIFSVRDRNAKEGLSMDSSKADQWELLRRIDWPLNRSSFRCG
jgi:hypothetical protein